MMQTRQPVTLPTIQQQLLLEQFQIESTNKTISFSILKKICLSVLSNLTVTQQVLDIICMSQKIKTEGITAEQFLSYVKVITRQLSHHIQDSHCFGIFVGTQLVKLIDKKLIIQKQPQQLPVYKVPKDLHEFLHQPQSDNTVRYSNDLLSDYAQKQLNYKKKPHTYRLWNFQAETKEKNSNTFKEKLTNKYSQLLRASFGLQFKYMLETIKDMDQNNKELRVLKMITKQWSDLEDHAGFDRELNKFFKTRETFECQAFVPRYRNATFQIVRNKVQLLVKWCASLSKTFENHYLKAITTYWGNQRDWTGEMFPQISFNDNISLLDRFFFAKWNMSKEMYTKFVQQVKKIGSESSKLQYILFFGRRPGSAQILQKYYDVTLDIQTVALLSIYFIIGKFDGKTSRHQNIYEHLLNTYKSCLKNSNKNIILQIFQKKEREIQAEQNIKDQRAISMRCTNCGCNLSLDAPINTKNTKQAKQLNTLPILQQCPFCGVHVHRCSTCLIPVQVKNPNFKSEDNKKSDNYQKDPASLDMAIVFCLKCKHGGHFFHIYEWFIHQTICAIPQCGCECYL